MEKSTNSTDGAAQQAEQARNGHEGRASTDASGGAASVDAEFHIPSVSDPEATDLPTSSMPHPESAHPGDPNSVAVKDKTTKPKE